MWSIMRPSHSFVEIKRATIAFVSVNRVVLGRLSLSSAGR